MEPLFQKCNLVYNRTNPGVLSSSISLCKYAMARNVEIKAAIESLEQLLPTIASLADSGPTYILQDDTFFCCPKGRLKLRKFSETQGELIYYERPDCAEPKESFYVVVPTHAPDGLRQALALSFGVVGRVHKTRTLFMLGRTRIHLDRVEDLGDFLELEVVLAESEALENGIAMAQDILNKLAVSPQQLVPCAYIDLLTKPK
jgi:predicted adenylyl cyclase CyaB